MSRFLYSKYIIFFQKIIIITFLFFLVLHPLKEARAINSGNISKNNFIGTWKGEGTIIVAWSKQKKISFELQIDKNGNVSGNIGNAYIRQGRIKLNKIIYRWLGNSDYIIDAKLSNYLIKKEEIKRESIRIFLDFKQTFYTGNFHTSGSKFGGKNKMILSGVKIKLVKVLR